MQYQGPQGLEEGFRGVPGGFRVLGLLAKRTFTWLAYRFSGFQEGLY